MAIGSKLLTVLAVFVAGVIYAGMLFVLGVLTREEAKKLPIIRKFL